MTSRRPIKKFGGLKSATQAEILRAHQRDDEFVRGLREKFLDLLHNFGGYRTLLPFIQSDILLKLLYFGFTSGIGNQTLGEEYTGIVQADLEAHRVPSLSVYGKRPTDGISWGLRLLGLATLAQCALKIYRGEEKIDGDDSLLQEEEGNKCQLCLEAVPTTTTPCGHLFCWNCLGDWLRTRSQCPYCREHVTPSRIVYLMNL
ncbi:peroxisome biogenesis factor 10 isoform X2 [Diachasmimorpha longicaudata]|uniref:peroxisome biogenesis factor 10 isoform X2 n=1 Tax=Diachasmimorpha longicaudata TaxID=58733 RepID=UPI0030B8EA9C